MNRQQVEPPPPPPPPSPPTRRRDERHSIPTQQQQHAKRSLLFLTGQSMDRTEAWRLISPLCPTTSPACSTGTQIRRVNRPLRWGWSMFLPTLMVGGLAILRDAPRSVNLYMWCSPSVCLLPQLLLDSVARNSSGWLIPWLALVAASRVGGRSRGQSRQKIWWAERETEPTLCRFHWLQQKGSPRRCLAWPSCV